MAMVDVDIGDFYFENPEITTTEEWDGVASSVEAGHYIATVADVKREPSKVKQISQLIVTWQIDTLVDGADTPMQGRRVMQRYNEADKGLKRTKHVLGQLGVQINERGGYNAREAVGRQAAIEVYREQYQASAQDGSPEMRWSTKVRGERALEEVAAPEPVKPTKQATKSRNGSEQQMPLPNTTRSQGRQVVR